MDDLWVVIKSHQFGQALASPMLFTEYEARREASRKQNREDYEYNGQAALKWTFTAVRLEM